MAVSVKMSSKNQIVVPREAREALGLVAGDRLIVAVRPDGVIEMQREPRDTAAELDGLLGPAAPADDGLWEELDP